MSQRRAFCLIRDEPAYRAQAFRDGLKRAGCNVFNGAPGAGDIKKTDVLVVWNRYDRGHFTAIEFEKVGATVLVVENGYMGRDWLGTHWYAMSRNWHNGRGAWMPQGSERWDSFGFPLEPMREKNPDGHVLLLPQRGFGPKECAMPEGWAKEWSRHYEGRGFKVRVRPHPGNKEAEVPLEKDLEGCQFAVTHGSGAGIKAMAMGYEVRGTWPSWIGLNGNSRLEVFQNLAYAMWSVDELKSGLPFERLI